MTGHFRQLGEESWPQTAQGDPVEEKVKIAKRNQGKLTYSRQSEVVFICNCLRPSLVLLVGFQIPPGLATIIIDQSPATKVGLGVTIAVGLQVALSRAPPGTNM
jgi:hypothetical protein